MVSSDGPAAGESRSRRQSLAAFEDRIFTERRLKFYGTGVLVGIALAVLLQWAHYRGHWVIRPDGRLGSIDFCWIWVSGKFAAFPNPVRIYDRALYAAAQGIFYPPGQCRFMHQYVYPPIFLFFSWPLARMPYLAAYAVWVSATLALYLAAVYAILPRRAALIAALTPAAALKNLQLGHNGFLTAGLLGLALAFVERRPWLAGILLGLLTAKPQFGVLVPLALLAAKNWRALISAATASLLLALAAALAFGWRTWPAFLTTLLDRNADLSPQPGAEFMLESVYGLLHWAGAPAWLAWAAHLATALCAAGAVWAVWARAVPYPLKAAMLCLASLLVSPYLLPYDLCAVSVGAAFLVRDGIGRGFLAGERTILLLCFILMLTMFGAVGPPVSIVLLLLVMRRIAMHGREDPALVRAEDVAATAAAGPAP